MIYRAKDENSNRKTINLVGHNTKSRTIRRSNIKYIKNEKVGKISIGILLFLIFFFSLSLYKFLCPDHD